MAFPRNPLLSPLCCSLLVHFWLANYFWGKSKVWTVSFTLEMEHWGNYLHNPGAYHCWQFETRETWAWAMGDLVITPFCTFEYMQRKEPGLLSQSRLWNLLTEANKEQEFSETPAFSLTGVMDCKKLWLLCSRNHLCSSLPRHLLRNVLFLKGLPTTAVLETNLQKWTSPYFITDEFQILSLHSWSPNRVWYVTTGGAIWI